MFSPSSSRYGRGRSSNTTSERSCTVEDKFTTIRGDVEVAYVEVRREVGQLPLRTRFQMDEPEVFVMNFSLQQHQVSSSGQKRQMARPASESERRQSMRRRFGGDGFHGECGADIGAGVANKTAIWRSRRIDRIPGDKRSGGATVDGYAKEMGYAVIVGRRGDGATVGRPCRGALQVERISHDARVAAVGLLLFSTVLNAE